MARRALLFLIMVFSLMIVSWAGQENERLKSHIDKLEGRIRVVECRYAGLKLEVMKKGFWVKESGWEVAVKRRRD